MTTIIAQTPGTEISDYEQERGKPMPSLNHSYVQLRLGAEFLVRHPNLISFSELTLQVAYDHRRTPDLSVYAEHKVDFRRDVIAPDEPPLTVVEIFSPSQSPQDVMALVDEYFSFGVKTCWLVTPYLRNIAIFCADGQEVQFSKGIALDPITGLSADLANVFKRQPGPAAD